MHGEYFVALDHTEMLTLLARAITMDPNVYNEPHEFRPERFLPENGEPYPTGASFGYGRRYVCLMVTCGFAD